jgi:hypothetical protein
MIFIEKYLQPYLNKNSVQKIFKSSKNKNDNLKYNH